MTRKLFGLLFSFAMMTRLLADDEKDLRGAGNSKKAQPPGSQSANSQSELSGQKLHKSCMPILVSMSPRLDWSGSADALDKDPYIAFVQLDRVLASLERLRAAVDHPSNAPALETALGNIHRIHRFTNSDTMKALVATVLLSQSTAPGMQPPSEQMLREKIEAAAAGLPKAQMEQLRHELATAFVAQGHHDAAKVVLPEDQLKALLDRVAKDKQQIPAVVPGVSAVKYLVGQLNDTVTEVRRKIQPHIVDISEKIRLIPPTVRPGTLNTGRPGVVSDPDSRDDKKKEYYDAFYQAIEALLGRPLTDEERVLAARLGRMNYSAGQVVGAIRRFTESLKVPPGSTPAK